MRLLFDRRGLTRLRFAVSPLVGVAQVLPGVTPAELLDGTRRDSQLLRPVGGRVLPPVPTSIPILQNLESFLLGHPSVGGLFPSKPDIAPLPTPRFLNGTRELGSRISEAVMPDLIDGELGEFSRDLRIRIAFLRKITPDNHDGACGFCHIFNFLAIALLRVQKEPLRIPKAGVAFKLVALSRTPIREVNSWPRLHVHIR